VSSVSLSAVLAGLVVVVASTVAVAVFSLLGRCPVDCCCDDLLRGSRMEPPGMPVSLSSCRACTCMSYVA